MDGKFRAGDRVRISPNFHWAQSATGTISMPHPEVATFSSSLWNDDGVSRQVQTQKGEKTSYWVQFDEPQIDADGDGPYRGAEIDVDALTKLPDSN
jgi:hypothetical protein